VTDINRRDALKTLGIVPLAGLMEFSPVNVERATKHIAALVEADSGAAYTPKFFTAHEWKTVRMLADIIIPKDDRSGSATDAKAPEFMDFMLAEKDTSENQKVQMRGGLAWLDSEMKHRFGKDFISAADAERTQVLDDIAYGKKVKPELRRGAAFFDRFRNSVAGAFYSTPMGWRDVQYMGNVFNPNWQGCPPEATKKLGVSYAEYDASLARSRNQK
jgi:gluconate 2-dehydrogenase gamma chain